MIENQTILNDLALAVVQGLSATPKRLPSWIFYDETGDKLFQEIMKMPEYYLTRSEFDALQSNKEKIAQAFSYASEFKLIEFGAGDGTKTKILLKELGALQKEFTYYPVDVSENVLDQLKIKLNHEIPSLPVIPINHRYEDAIQLFAEENYTPKVFLFLGANIGNFTREEACQFMKKISHAMDKDDKLLVGFDLKKDPRMIHTAYDDSHGITRDFNLNLLKRINRELGADFDVNSFTHYPTYDPESGTMKSYLISQYEQDIRFSLCDKVFHFNRWEVIHTEISQKYDFAMIAELAKLSNLTIGNTYYDCNGYFCDVLFIKS